MLYRAASLAAAADEPLLGDTSMRLVFVHGIHEEHKAPAALRQVWEDALLSAWTTAGLSRPNYT